MSTITVQAHQMLERILSLDPHNVPALNNKGNALVNLRRLDDARAAFERVIELEPAFVAAWINLANTLSSLERYDDAKAASDHALALAPESPAANTETAHRILIIDDEAGIRESLETLLGLEGYAVDTAPDGEAGLNTIGQRSYDLVLLDLALPGMNGIEVLARSARSILTCQSS